MINVKSEDNNTSFLQQSPLKPVLTSPVLAPVTLETAQPTGELATGEFLADDELEALKAVSTVDRLGSFLQLTFAII